jgi:2,5-diketo-D-gluconate reductase A
MNEKEVGIVVNNAIATGRLTEDELFVTTKIWHNQYSDPEAAFKESFAEMKLDATDFYVIHSPNNHFSKPQVQMHKLW